MMFIERTQQFLLRCGQQELLFFLTVLKPVQATVLQSTIVIVDAPSLHPKDWHCTAGNNMDITLLNMI